LAFSLIFKQNLLFFGLKAKEYFGNQSINQIKYIIFNPIFEKFIAYENKNY
jgi:hypothetical protein